MNHYIIFVIGLTPAPVILKSLKTIFRTLRHFQMASDPFIGVAILSIIQLVEIVKAWYHLLIQFLLNTFNDLYFLYVINIYFKYF